MISVLFPKDAVSNIFFDIIEIPFESNEIPISYRVFVKIVIDFQILICKIMFLSEKYKETLFRRVFQILY